MCFQILKILENKKISGRLATAQSKQHKVQYTFINNSGDRGFYQLLMKCPWRDGMKMILYLCDFLTRESQCKHEKNIRQISIQRPSAKYLSPKT